MIKAVKRITTTAVSFVLHEDGKHLSEIGKLILDCILMWLVKSELLLLMMFKICNGIRVDIISSAV